MATFLRALSLLPSSLFSFVFFFPEFKLQTPLKSLSLRTPTSRSRNISPSSNINPRTSSWSDHRVPEESALRLAEAFISSSVRKRLMKGSIMRSWQNPSHGSIASVFIFIPSPLTLLAHQTAGYTEATLKRCFSQPLLSFFFVPPGVLLEHFPRDLRSNFASQYFTHSQASGSFFCKLLESLSIYSSFFHRMCFGAMNLRRNLRGRLNC